MGKHKTKTCNVCFKSMRSDNLKRHMKKHDGKTEKDIVTKGLHDGKTEDNVANNKEQTICTSYSDEKLEERVSA